jgi:YD repeat-containing protein
LRIEPTNLFSPRAVISAPDRGVDLSGWGERGKSGAGPGVSKLGAPGPAFGTWDWSQTTSSAYDANGNKFYDIDARGYKTSYVYDALNRLVETDYIDQTKPAKSYDFRNNVIRETDQAGDVTLAGVGSTIYG